MDKYYNAISKPLTFFSKLPCVYGSLFVCTRFYNSIVTRSLVTKCNVNNQTFGALYSLSVGYWSHYLFPFLSWDAALYFFVRSINPITFFKLSKSKSHYIRMLIPTLVSGIIMYDHCYSARFAAKQTIKFAMGTIGVDYDSALGTGDILDPIDCNVFIKQLEKEKGTLGKEKGKGKLGKQENVIIMGSRVRKAYETYVRMCVSQTGEKIDDYTDYSVYNYNRDSSKYLPDSCELFVHPKCVCKHSCLKSYFWIGMNRLYKLMCFYIKLFSTITIISKLITNINGLKLKQLQNQNGKLKLKLKLKLNLINTIYKIFKNSMKSSLLFLLFFHNGFYFFCILKNFQINPIAIKTKLFFIIICMIHGYIGMKIQGNINRINGLTLLLLAKLIECRVNGLCNIQFRYKRDKNHFLHYKNYIASAIFAMAFSVNCLLMKNGNQDFKRTIEYQILKPMFN